MIQASFPGIGERPLHLLVPSRQATRIGKNVHTHLAPASLPAGSFYQIAPNLFVCSPELTLVQLARFSSVVRLAEIASEMLSDYYIHPRSHELKKRLRRIATEDSMRTFIGSAQCRGLRKSLRAIELALGSARSPMEIKFGLIIALPRLMHGYAFPRPILNYAVPLEGKRHLVEQDSFRVDVAYPVLQVGAEYLGEDYHTDSAEDLRRINGLRALGWEILTVDKRQLYNPSAFHTFMLQLAEVMNERISALPSGLLLDDVGCLVIADELGYGRKSRNAARPKDADCLGVSGGSRSGRSERQVRFVHVPPAAEMLQPPHLALRGELGLTG